MRTAPDVRGATNHRAGPDGVPLATYQQALDYLFARTTGGFKFGLERTRALLEALGNPHVRFPSLHIAGTNGKGSSVATMDALLRAKGMRVGRYTSPHLVDFRELADRLTTYRPFEQDALARRDACRAEAVR